MSTRLKENGKRCGVLSAAAFTNVRKGFIIQKLNQQQEKAIRCIFLDKKDVFVHFPAGFGKSMLFHGLPEVFSSLHVRETY